MPFLHTRENVVQHNEIHHALQMLGDGAAINISGAGEGNVIRRNYVHDIENTSCTSCIRTDDFQKGTLIEENIVFRAKIGGLKPKYENHFVNNFLIAVGGPGGDGIHSSGKWGPFGNARIERNIFINPGPGKRFWGGFTPKDISKLTGCKIDNNIYSHLQAQSPTETQTDPFLAALRKAGHDAHAHYGDPGFVDWEKADFHFRPDAAALKLGIIPLHLGNVGLTPAFPQRFRP